MIWGSHPARPACDEAGDMQRVSARAYRLTLAYGREWSTLPVTCRGSPAHAAGIGDGRFVAGGGHNVWRAYNQ